MRLIKNQAGQTLLEVVVAMGVAVVIIGSLVTLMNASNRRSTLARQATQASKLAQEGLEIVRNIRDVNAVDSVRIGSCAVTPCNFGGLYLTTQGTRIGQLQNPNTPGCTPSNSYCLVGLGLGSGEVKTLGTASYTRTVTIRDTGAPNICATGTGLTDKEVKKVMVTVTWSSPIGTQERKAESCLTNWQK
jgi:type II secretory pathway pseudopilin PulG